jgi:hypothetical protein
MGMGPGVSAKTCTRKPTSPHSANANQCTLSSVILPIHHGERWRMEGNLCEELGHRGRLTCHPRPSACRPHSAPQASNNRQHAGIAPRLRLKTLVGVLCSVQSSLFQVSNNVLRIPLTQKPHNQRGGLHGHKIRYLLRNWHGTIALDPWQSIRRQGCRRFHSTCNLFPSYISWPPSSWLHSLEICSLSLQLTSSSTLTSSRNCSAAGTTYVQTLSKVETERATSSQQKARAGILPG